MYAAQNSRKCFAIPNQRTISPEVLIDQTFMCVFPIMISNHLQEQAHLKTGKVRETPNYIKEIRTYIRIQIENMDIKNTLHMGQ